MNKKFIDIRVTAISDEDLKDFLVALRKIQYCGDIGRNVLLPLRIDGDGSGRISIDVHTKEITTPKLNNLRNIIKFDTSDIQKVFDGEDFETHYIGE